MIIGLSSATIEAKSGKKFVCANGNVNLEFFRGIGSNQGLKGLRNRVWLINSYNIFFWDYENILKLAIEVVVVQHC